MKLSIVIPFKNSCLYDNQSQALINDIDPIQVIS